MSYVGIGNRQDYIADFPTQSFNGDGSTTTFTLNFEAVTGSVRVAVDNVLQPADGTSYYTNGNSITFTSAPATGTANITVTYLGTVRNVSSVSDGAITTAKLADGAVTNVKLANSSITVNGTSIALGASGNISAGITEADQWRLTTNFTGNATPISSNLERVDTNGFGYIGTGMTQSSGVFTFPSTGIWLIRYTGRFRYNTYSRYCEGFIQTTTNNSTYNNASGFSTILARIEAGDMETSSSCEFIFDVTSTSTHKTRFIINLQNTGSTVQGNSDVNLTCFTFIRLGDT